MHPLVFAHVLLGRLKHSLASYVQGKLEVLRAGKVRQMELTLSVYNRLIPEHLSNRPPTYYIIAGFVFTQVICPPPPGPEHLDAHGSLVLTAWIADGRPTSSRRSAHLT